MNTHDLLGRVYLTNLHGYSLCEASKQQRERERERERERSGERRVRLTDRLTETDRDVER